MGIFSLSMVGELGPIIFFMVGFIYSVHMSPVLLQAGSCECP